MAMQEDPALVTGPCVEREEIIVLVAHREATAYLKSGNAK